jgi:hypothetical protein
MQGKNWTWWTPGFLLLIVMLVVFIVLVLAVLLIPFPIPDQDVTTKHTDVLAFRLSILAVIVTAFAAWVGAGVAYFLGRENLRETATSLLAMRGPAAIERLWQTIVRDIPPRTIAWRVTNGDSLENVLTSLEAHPEYLFVTVVKSDGSLSAVVEPVAFWRFVCAQFRDAEDRDEKVGVIYSEVMKMTVAQVLEKEELKRYRDRYVPARLENTVGDVSASMRDKGVVLAVVSDDAGKPTHYFTNTDVWRVMLRDA